MTPEEAKNYVRKCVQSNVSLPSTNSLVDELWEEGLERNKQIASIFKQLATEYRVHKDHFRYRAYDKASSIISNYKIPIISGKQAIKIKGIGKGISNKIDEFIKTGKVPRLGEKVSSEEVEIVKNFMKVWGIGPAKARYLYSKGYRKIAEIPDSELDASQIIGKKYINELNRKIPRKEITAFEKKLKSIIEKIDGKYKFCICGSYRRGLPSSGDIDILVTFPDEKGKLSHTIDHISIIVSALEEKGILTDTLALGKKKYMGIGLLDRTHRRVDIRYIEPSSWGAGMLYFTGSKQFNINIRNQVKDKGYLLNEWGIWNKKTGKYVPAETEKDIFKILDIKYVPPEKRS